MRHGLARRRGPVDADLGEDPDRQRIDALGDRAGRSDGEVRAAEPLEERLGDLAPGRVPGADEEDADRRVGHGSVLPGGAGAPGGGDRGAEVAQLAVEPIELGALAVDRSPLRGDERREVEVDRAVVEAQPRHASGVLRAEAEPPEADDEAEPGEVGGIEGRYPLASVGQAG